MAGPCCPALQTEPCGPALEIERLERLCRHDRVHGPLLHSLLLRGLLPGNFEARESWRS
jgi:hypothetical protein